MRDRSPARTDSSRPVTGWLLPVSLVGAGALSWACQDAEGEGDDGSAAVSSQAKREVLDSIATQVVAPATADFETAARDLDAAVAAWAAAPTDEATRETARQAWRDAMVQWQVLEVMQIGPAAPSLSAVAGEDLRDAVYSWPTIDTCSIDRALAEQLYAGPDFFATQLVWSYGMDALEYLLFASTDTHTCPALVELDGTWSAMSSDDLASRRTAYAVVVADAVTSTAADLSGRWSGEFADSLATAGEPGSAYASADEALDEVFRAMFYVDKQTKDAKLGVPLGMVEGCAAAPCVDLLELPHGELGAEAIAANLRALRQLVLGGRDERGTGFDDLLVEAGHPEIANTLISQIDLAISAAEGFEGSLQEIAATDPAALTPLYNAIKSVTDTLKGPFVMTLQLTIPAEGAGDND